MLWQHADGVIADANQPVNDLEQASKHKSFMLDFCSQYLTKILNILQTRLSIQQKLLCDLAGLK